MEAMGKEYNNKLNHFEEQLTLGLQYKNNNIPPTRSSNVLSIVENLSKMLEDDTFRPLLGARDIQRYLSLLNHATFKSRTFRLKLSNNRDSDQYSNDNLKDEIMLKQSLLKISDWIGSGQLNSILNIDSIKFLFYTMLQFKLEPEIISIWESGVNCEGEIGKSYLNQQILSIVLKIAYELKRFNYEEILNIYELNVNSKKGKVGPEIYSCIGRIAIEEGDYTKALDCLESLLLVFEEDPRSRYIILTSLSELHLSFIGNCTDLKIAKHFFDKIVDKQLPYDIQLKVPYVQLLLENCSKSEDSEVGLAEMEYFWTRTLEHFVTSTKPGFQMNSRYSNLNNTFFKIFFDIYPELNEESYSKLKQLIKTYTDIKVVDEFFLNTVISNYNWGNKMVLDQLIEYYTLYNVERTQVLYRICLKKTGTIQDITNEEIYSKWLESLRFLDEQRFNYIPIADWAALRDATILSEFSAERKEFYLAVVDKYKDYIQDYKTCIRFCKHWLKQREYISDIVKLSDENHTFTCEDVNIEIPEFNSLKKNINFKVFSKEIFSK